MSQENVEIVRELWDAYSRGDFDHVLALNDPHVVHVTLEEGAVYGSDAVHQNFERWKETWEDLESTVEEVIGVGDKVFVVARIRGRGRASGVEVEGRFFEVYTLRNRKVVRYEEFREKAAALEAVGLSEKEAHADS